MREDIIEIEILEDGTIHLSADNFLKTIEELTGGQSDSLIISGEVEWCWLPAGTNPLPENQSSAIPLSLTT